MTLFLNHSPIWPSHIFNCRRFFATYLRGHRSCEAIFGLSLDPVNISKQATHVLGL